MRLIGLHARLQAGKDTAYEVIDQYAIDNDLLAIRRAFADPLKVSGMRALGFPSDYEQETLVFLANQIKESGRVTVSWEGPDGVLESRCISGRQLWQNYGTAAHRADDLGSSFGSDFWIDNTLPLGEEPVEVWTADIEDIVMRPLWWHNFKESWAGFADIAVVTDVRFENEANRIHTLGGEVWRIDADRRLGENRDAHISEQPLPSEFVDRVIDNNESIEQFQDNVVAALDEMVGHDVDD